VRLHELVEKCRFGLMATIVLGQGRCGRARKALVRGGKGRRSHAGRERSSCATTSTP
jgi:hypothetical protein